MLAGRPCQPVSRHAASLSATNPASLAEATLNNATVTVLLGGTTFASGVSASSYALVTNPAVSGLSVANVTGGASGSTSATLTLAFTGGFSAPTTLAVRVLAAAHTPHARDSLQSPRHPHHRGQATER